MSDEAPISKYPELIIGIAGPIGIDIQAISEAITSCLKDVNYIARGIHVTKIMVNYPAPNVDRVGDDYHSEMTYKINYANKLCAERDDPATLMRIAMQNIGIYRQTYNKSRHTNIRDTELRHVPIPKSAFIIRQLKRPEEVRLLRRVYGKNFILISGYASEVERRSLISKKIRDSLPVGTKNEDISQKTENLISRDAEESEDYGQHLRDTFHLADLFIDGVKAAQMREQISRFINAFFGAADIAPNKGEYGIYAAKAASLRSCDLSRQVGAAVFTKEGELVSQGCNEVPKAFGGTYWDGEDPDHRDVKLGRDPNDYVKKEALRGLVEILNKKDLLSTKAKSITASEKLVETLLGELPEHKNLDFYGCLKGTTIASITEFGRVVHAEMSAICDAARLGRALKGAILYCTTFPCHNCTKHILAAGIQKVVYIEPYPKSRAKDLHYYEIEMDEESDTRVSFVPFLGIAPYRYRDIFQKGSRKEFGTAKKWYHGEPRPMFETIPSAYAEAEKVEVARLVGEIQAALL